MILSTGKVTILSKALKEQSWQSDLTWILSTLKSQYYQKLKKNNIISSLGSKKCSCGKRWLFLGIRNAEEMQLELRSSCWLVEKSREVANQIWTRLLQNDNWPTDFEAESWSWRTPLLLENVNKMPALPRLPRHAKLLYVPYRISISSIDFLFHNFHLHKCFLCFYSVMLISLYLPAKKYTSHVHLKQRQICAFAVIVHYRTSGGVYVPCIYSHARRE